MMLFLILLSVPIIEIALFVTVGDQIGLLPTLTIVFVTALIGAAALRSQGFAALRRAQSFSKPEEVSDALIDGLFLLISGLLLLTPGFMTDTIGFLLLIPAVRRMLARHVGRYAMSHVVFTNGGASASAGWAPHSSRENAQHRAAANDAGAAPRRPAEARSGESSPWATHEPEPDRASAEEAVVLDESPPTARKDDGRS